MKHLRQYKALGMPWHGKAVGGDLTTPVGTLTINGEGGAVVVRHPQAPGASRTPEQQVYDTARGHQWRDYGLLCGNARYVNGGPALGANAWLYCAPDGRTWRITVEKNYTSGDTATFEIWRRELFGNFRVPAHQILDEKIGEMPITFVLPEGYAGADTAAGCAANARVDKAAAIVPNPAGNSVFVHVFLTNAVYTATQSLLGGGVSQVYAIIELSLSGSGDVAFNGTGISASFPNVDVYADLVEDIDEALIVGAHINALVPDWDTCETTYGDPPPPDPQEAGLVWEKLDQSNPYWQGHTQVWRTGVGTFRKGIVYRTHFGDVTVTNKSYNVSFYEWSIIGTTRQRLETWVSESDGQGGFVWVSQGVEYTVDIFHSELNDLPGQTGRNELLTEFRVEFDGMSFGGYTLFIDGYERSWSLLEASGGGWCAGSWGGSPPSTEVFAEVNETDLGTLSNGMTLELVELVGNVTIHPGFMVVNWAFNNLNNDGLRAYKYRMVGFGEAQSALFASHEFEYNKDASPPASSYPGRIAFQPVTLEGDYELGSAGPDNQYC